MARQVKRIRQIRPVADGASDMEERVIEVPVEATVPGVEDVPAGTELHGWRPAVRR